MIGSGRFPPKNKKRWSFFKKWFKAIGYEVRGKKTLLRVKAKTMVRSELIEKIQRKFPHFTQKNVEKIISVIFDAVGDALADGKRVEFRGFGSFTVRWRSPRIARNPRTGERVSVGAKAVPFFRHSLALKDKINPEQK